MRENIVVILGCVGLGMLVTAFLVWFYQKTQRKKEREFSDNLLNGVANSADLLVLLYSPKKRRTEFISDSIRWMFGIEKERVEKNIWTLFEALNFPANDSFVQYVLEGNFLLSTQKEYTVLPLGAKEKMHLKVKAMPYEGDKILLIIRDDTYVHSVSDALYTAATVMEILQQKYGFSSELHLLEEIKERAKSVFEEPQEELRYEEKEKDSVEEGSYSDKHILLVEDSEKNRQFARELLQKTGVGIDMAVNGQEAVEMFTDSKEGYYDLVLMDIQMPVMDGNEATKRIRALERRDAKVVPIVAMTTYLFAEDIRSSFRAGMDMHIAKPLSNQKLTDVVRKYLAR